MTNEVTVKLAESFTSAVLFLREGMKGMILTPADLHYSLWYCMTKRAFQRFYSYGLKRKYLFICSLYFIYLGNSIRCKTTNAEHRDGRASSTL